MKIKSFILSTILVLSLQSCSMSDVFSMFTPSKGIDVDAELTIGDKHEEIATGAVIGTKETTTNNAEQLSQVFNTVNEEAPLLPWILAMLFLMLPTPTRMGKGLWGVITRQIERNRK